ncbi:DUF3813 domain-containing protein [Metabacillus sp. RGM 3146]|uniref:DUF3813 domain-containing protein n=1 Tax=Metabacillus sp. RGM 3146 TaxID=3401092 RepID=UPI003B9A3A9F
MANKLFQKARETVRSAEHPAETSQTEASSKAQQAISSAYAQSSEAERRQLRELQDELNELK